jgi:hypothetical protein
LVKTLEAKLNRLGGDDLEAVEPIQRSFILINNCERESSVFVMLGEL